ncbi:hypothetical protein [Amycolatopsis magusensis]|uniref:hypothetical protein n=1 Tax=Amycolatopsis magusensis TaxID=882444 RepID=UPI003C2DB37E
METWSCSGDAPRPRLWSGCWAGRPPPGNLHAKLGIASRTELAGIDFDGGPRLRPPVTG